METRHAEKVEIECRVHRFECDVCGKLIEAIVENPDGSITTKKSNEFKMEYTIKLYNPITDTVDKYTCHKHACCMKHMKALLQSRDAYATRHCKKYSKLYNDTQKELLYNGYHMEL